MGTAMELVEMGQKARNEGETEDALTLYAAAADLLLEEDDRVRWAHTLRHVADLKRELGKLEEARQSIEAVIVFYETHEPAPLEMANSVRIAALVEEAAGRAEDARAFWQQALDLYEEAGVQAGVDNARQRLEP